MSRKIYSTNFFNSDFFPAASPYVIHLSAFAELDVAVIKYISVTFVSQNNGDGVWMTWALGGPVGVLTPTYNTPLNPIVQYESHCRITRQVAVWEDTPLTVWCQQGLYYVEIDGYHLIGP